jgi:hypothetical protein
MSGLRKVLFKPTRSVVDEIVVDDLVTGLLPVGAGVLAF